MVQHLFIVLRLLCIPKGILTGKKSGSFFWRINWQLALLKIIIPWIPVQVSPALPTPGSGSP